MACNGGKSEVCNNTWGAWSNRRAVCDLPGSIPSGQNASPGKTDNKIIFNDGTAGGWGGTCTCPDGLVYYVGDQNNSCGSLACINGKSGTCHRFSGPWYHRKVICAVVSIFVLDYTKPVTAKHNALKANIRIRGKGSYQWQISTDNITWSKITGATGAIYKMKKSDLSKYIRVQVTIGSSKYLSIPLITNDNIKKLVTHYFDSSKTANIKNLYGEIKTWNVSHVSIMENLFKDMTTFNEDISEWDTSKVENMASMFSGADNFNQPIGKWNVSKVTNMQEMFNNTKSFNQTLAIWDVSKVTNMSNMFKNSIKMIKHIKN